MGNIDCVIGEYSKTTQLERVRYYPRQLITAADLMLDQQYHIEKQRRHNRMLHGWGIVCGLEVTQLTGKPLIVTISSGYALSPQGDEIYLPEEFQFDLEQYLKGQVSPCASPCGSVISELASITSPFYIAIRYAECLSNPVRVSPLGCGCDDTACEYSRIRDGFELTCLQTLPVTHGNSDSLVDVCGEEVMSTKVVPCIPCSQDPWIVLAKITKVGDVLSFEPDGRRLLLATNVMQQHLISKCSL